jgi:hypothetical protein
MDKFTVNATRKSGKWFINAVLPTGHLDGNGVSLKEAFDSFVSNLEGYLIELGIESIEKK